MRGSLLLAAAIMPLFTTSAVAGKPQAVRAGQAKSDVTPTQLPRPKIESLTTVGRIIFPPAGPLGYTAAQDGDRLIVTHSAGGRVADPPRLPRNVLSMQSDATTTALRLVPGTIVSASRKGARFLVELFDPPPTVRVSGLVMPPGSEPLPDPVSDPTQIRPAVAVTDDIAPDLATAARPGRTTDAQVDPVVVQVPSRPAPVEIETVSGTTAPTILLRAGRDVGLAAFRVGPELLIVLDAPIEFRPASIDLEPMFRSITSLTTQNATVLRLPIVSDKVRLTHSPRGWLVTAAAPQNAVGGIVPQLVEEAPDRIGLLLPMSAPSRVVSVIDPETGTSLLVGTQTVSGQAITTSRAMLKFTLRPTLQGVVVATKSDDIRLRRDAGGFRLQAGPHSGDTLVSAEERNTVDAQLRTPMSRLFDIPSGDVQTLSRRLEQQTRAAADAPALARSAQRIALSETYIALGMGVEAEAVLDVALTEDPALRDLPLPTGLRAAAALLASRTTEAVALTDPRLDGTAELELWRALLKSAQRSVTEQDAHQLANNIPLLLSYPPLLRDRLLPSTLETLALNGELEAAQSTLKWIGDEPPLELTRAIVLEAAGQNDAALSLYDRVAGQANRLPRYRAIVRAVELRLRSGQIDAGKAADALDHALFGWRGAQQELELRIRLAALRRKLGQWREALAVLRDGLTAFPDDHQALDREMVATVEALFTVDAASRLAPAEFVDLYDANVDAIRSITWTEQNGIGLVDQLTALGLLGRAEPLLVQILAHTQDGGRRAIVGARLAKLRLETGNPGGAILALSDTVPAVGTAAEASIMATRQMLYAQAEEARGNRETALRMLEEIGSAEADDARADIQGRRGDWPGAVVALTALERRQIGTGREPVAALTPDQQALVMRLTVAATLAADATTVARMATSYGSAIENSPSGPIFRLMTSAPVRGTADLLRAYEEIKLAQQVRNQIGMEVRP